MNSNIKVTKVISLLTALIILMLSVSLPASAVEEIKAKDLPAIIVCGYASGQLYRNYGTAEQEKVWTFDVDDITSGLTASASDTAKTLTRLILGKWEQVGVDVGGGIYRILQPISYNTDCTPSEELSTYPNEPAVNNYKYMMDNGFEENIYEKAFTASVAEDVGGEKTFCFQYDMRTGIYDDSDALKVFIDKVLDYCDAEKVNLFGISMGGYICGTYMVRYGLENKIYNCVLNVPAIGGTSFASIFISGETDVDLYFLASFGESLLGKETGFAKILKGAKATWAENFMRGFCEGAGPLFKYWPSLWDLMPKDDYNKLKGELLDEEKCADMIAKSDYIHNVTQTQYKEKFNECLENGTHSIQIFVSTGYKTAFGGSENNDLLIDVKNASGAYCANASEHFESGYVQKNTSCTNPAHNHISPEYNIDASTAYLPENTWFVEGQYHGQFSTDPLTFGFMKTLLLADEKIDIYTFEDYPQFLESENACKGVTAKFNNDKTGFLTASSDKLTIKNISEMGSVTILSVKSSDGNISFSNYGKIIKKGESVDIPFKKTGNTGDYFTVTISFYRITSGVTERTFSFREI